jgi:hypothetical protein
LTFAALRKTILINIVFVLVLSALIFGIMLFQAPGAAEKKARETLSLLELETSLLPRPQHSWGRIAYNNVSLDKDEISTIKKYEVTYSPFSILISGKLKSVTFENMNLIGEWDPFAPANVDFSGWKSLNQRALALLPTEKISFQKAKLSVLTPSLGGLSLDFDLEGSYDKNKLEFQSHLSSAQKYISFTGSARGVVTTDYTNIDVELDEGKFEVPETNIRLIRMHGWFNYTRDRSGAEKTMAELRAGGLTVLGMPWQNASATVELKDGGTKIFSEAKSVGVEEIELGLNLVQNPGKLVSINGDVHAPSGALLADYIANQTDFPLPAADMTIIKHANELKIDFAYVNGEPPKLQYRINTMDNAPVKEINLDHKPD